MSEQDEPSGAMPDAMRKRRFILEAIDPATECVSNDVMFEVENLSDLRAVVDPSGTAEVLDGAFELGKEEIRSICATFGLNFDPGKFRARIRPARRTDDLPYKIHTNRELAMMLKGTKPFAYFTDIYPSSPDFRLPEHLFDSYVTHGKFVKREYVIPTAEQADTNDGILGTRMILYALKGEEWRIEAFILVQKIAGRFGWNDGFEQMVGSLLGYEDWQNDAFIEHSRIWRATEHKGQ